MHTVTLAVHKLQPVNIVVITITFTYPRMVLDRRRTVNQVSQIAAEMPTYYTLLRYTDD